MMSAKLASKAAVRPQNPPLFPPDGGQVDPAGAGPDEMLANPLPHTAETIKSDAFPGVIVPASGPVPPPLSHVPVGTAPNAPGLPLHSAKPAARDGTEPLPVTVICSERDVDATVWQMNACTVELAGHAAVQVHVSTPSLIVTVVEPKMRQTGATSKSPSLTLICPLDGT